MNIQSVVKNIRNVMRQDKGINGDAQRIEQFGWLLFLKIFDAKDEEMEVLDNSDSYCSPIEEKYRWRNWAKNTEGITGEPLINFIDKELFPYLRGLNVLNNKRAGLLQDVFSGNNNYMKNGNLLRQVINELNAIDFHNLKDRHIFGEVYETILKELQSAGASGEFYTPRAITLFLTEMVNPQLGEKILDPACGTGGFLTAAIEHIRRTAQDNIEQRQILQNSIQGMELKPLPNMLAITNLILHDIEVPDIAYEDSLLKYRDITAKTRVDVILANPPFGGNVDKETSEIFGANFKTMESADLFVVMIINYLKQGGRAAIVLPDGSLTGDGVKARIREKLLRDCNLHTIIRLPNSVFKPYATVATNLLFFDKVKAPGDENTDFPTKEIWYYEHPYPEGSVSYSKTNPIDIKEFEPIKQWWNNRTESPLAWKINIEEIINNADQRAEIHRQNAAKATAKANDLKEKIRKLKFDTGKLTIDKEIEKGKLKLEKLEAELSETENTAKSESQTANLIYYSAFNLDYKNPASLIEKETEDIFEIISHLQKSQIETDNLINDIKKVLEAYHEV